MNTSSSFTTDADAKSPGKQSNPRFGGRYQPEVPKKSSSSWNQIALIMRNKPNIDEIDIDDLYNNLGSCKMDERSSSSTSTSQNMAFLSSENTSSTNEVSTASGDIKVSTAGGTSQVPSTLCAHDVALVDSNVLGGMTGAMILKMELLNPRADISFAGLDEYAIRKKIIESKTTDLNTKTSETVGKTNEANTQKPKTVYESVNKDKVIIEDWNSDDEDDVSEVQTSQEPKLKNVVNTGPRVNKPVWDNAKRQNEKRAVHKVSTARPVSTAKPVNTASLVSTAKPVSTARPVSIARPVNTVRLFAPKIAQTSGAIRPMYPRMDNIRRPRKGLMLLTLFAGNTNSSAVVFTYKQVIPLEGTMFFKSKLYTSSFLGALNELKFNIFYVSQMCDKKNSVLFTETECLILSPSFKLLDESQVVLRAPRKDDVYSLNLKNIVPSGGM
ncbi:hypothetical protein Tco_0039789, partial [Tanacetum coccineum]